ncbi:MAG TPA: molybdopterin converting factor subunit 1 [Bryobacteraceae bacterium]|nr:molybdopterin converting factor subunit 1 [Bryobacteraceae bacterium]
MRVHVLFFGVIREIVGLREDTIEVAPGARVESVLECYSNRHPRLREILPSVVIALNQQFAHPTATVADGDEVAFLPPVSGGAGVFTHQIVYPTAGHFFALTRDPIDGGAVARRLLRGEDGAFVNFEGVGRNNTKGRATLYLEYECYEPMAVKVMAEIGGEIAHTFAIGRIAMVHRLGRVAIGETSVSVVVTAPHRKPAFDAALEAINRLKRLVPIWKKEFFADGEVWVDGEWDESVVKAKA